MTSKMFIVGDFNIDYRKRYDVEYRLRDLFGCFDEILGGLNLVQMIDFPTWSRVVLNVYRESILDHVYCTDPELIENIHERTPTFGDHRLVLFSLSCEMPKIEHLIKRDWRNYTVEKLNSRLSTVIWENEIDQVQHYWNYIEREMVGIVDELAPMVPFVNNSTCSSTTPVLIKNKLNIRKRLLRSIKGNPNEEKRLRIKHLNIEIRNFYYGKTRLKVRRGILPGNSKSLWDAVKIAKKQGR